MWKKIGITFNPANDGPEWMKSHALMPLPLELEDRVRVYFTTRHVDGRSRISFVDLNKDNLMEVISINQEPLLEVGKPGTFDDCGTVATMVLRHESQIRLYYNGYNVRNTVPWSNSIGLAISDDNGKTFTKYSEGPIMDRNTLDPYYTISPAIIKSGDDWLMWYTSGSEWVKVDSRLEPTYQIKFAKSSNGIDWERKGEICIPQRNQEECVARASVLQTGEDLEMWFTYRGSRDFRDGVDSYRIGYAKANINDPVTWSRNDDLSGLDWHDTEYDARMQAYPAVISMKGKRFLFYSGNGFGESGICIAEWQG